ncbi:hypothetical protein [Massilia sp. YMA4]|uniref:PD-(D/E)XK endonuclease-like domain-containing protein n=1 Tax=[Empedobacter] haloabium TaxID=592317 RepID=A0ABZ1US74_9BURK|nr:hypothetical protein [Massilia sp. YMA4]AXA91353.1 hypothetical protein DPH57_09430 [Massilia sp. YMA4]
MFSNVYWLAIILVGIAGFVHVLAALWRERGWLPPDLARGQLIYSERLFHGDRELPVVARVDRAYLVDGVIHLVELKTRPRVRVYETDVVELSVQRVAVQISTGKAVSLIGTVVVQHTRSRKRFVRRVQLLDTAAVARLLRRRLLVLQGQAQPAATPYQGRCRTCEYRMECKGVASARVYPIVTRFH